MSQPLNKKNNPFEHDAARSLTPEKILDWYIDDHNFSRFLQSSRNIILFGNRGTGKSMTLLYNSFELSLNKAKREGTSVSYEKIGIYIPCNNPLLRREDHRLLEDNFHQIILNEHFLVLAIIFSISDSLSQDPQLVEEATKINLINQINYTLITEIQNNDNPFKALTSFVQREISKTQISINSNELCMFENRLFTFATFVFPFIDTLKQIPPLSNSHYSLMFDDADSLNEMQRGTLNSWLGFRDQSNFSFKVATANRFDWDFFTNKKGTIVEGHDFTVLDMEKPLQNPQSPFGNLAKKIIDKRLKLSGIDVEAERFFPIHPKFEDGLAKAKEETRIEALKKYPNGSTKQISDFLSKYSRANYFRKLNPKANKPLYSGFQTLVDLSTGVIRNLLDPCYSMYDEVVSQESGKDQPVILNIPPIIQKDIIKTKSENLWKIIHDGLDKRVEGCTHEQGIEISKFFDALADLFRKRLMKHTSEPRLLTFIISGLTQEKKEKIFPNFNIASKENLLYVRIGVGKDKGLPENYYVPNRMLWPAIGLDTSGQHGRASLKADDIINSFTGTSFPFAIDDKPQESNQREMFEE